MEVITQTMINVFWIVYVLCFTLSLWWYKTDSYSKKIFKTKDETIDFILFISLVSFTSWIGVVFFLIFFLQRNEKFQFIK